jgi:hypothetical protein
MMTSTRRYWDRIGIDSEIGLSFEDGSEFALSRELSQTTFPADKSAFCRLSDYESDPPVTY